MAIEKTTRPYEFLVRWGEDGTVQGAHIQFIDEVRDGDEIIAAKAGHAQVVSMAGETGFPLADVLSAMHVDALAAVDAAGAAADEAAEAQRSTAAELATAKADLAAARAQVSLLSAQLARLNERAAP